MTFLVSKNENGCGNHTNNNYDGMASMACTLSNVQYVYMSLVCPHLTSCSDRGGVERAAVWSVLSGLRDPSEDSDFISLSSSLLQLASTDSQWTIICTHNKSGVMQN